MFHYRVLLSGVLALSILTGCASAPPAEQQAESDWPEWYQVYENDDTVFYGFGEGLSARLNMATQQARLAAQTELGQSVGAHVQALVQEGAQQSLDDPQVRGIFESAQRSVMEQHLSGAKPDLVHRVREPDGSVRVFMRMSMSRDEAERTSRAVLERMDEQLDRVKASR